MDSSWELKKLGDVINLKRGYDLPTSKRIDGDIPIMASSGITGYHNEIKVKGPGVVTGRSGQLGKVFYIEEDYWALNTTLYVEDFKGNYPKYIYYLLQTLNFEQLNAGSSVPTLNRNHVHQLEVKIPPFNVQKRIGELLYQFEEKVLINNDLIQKLEQITQSLFKRWFIDFEFPNEQGLPYHSSGGEMVESELGLIPTDFYCDSIENLALVIDNRGKTPPLVEVSNYPIIDVKALGGDSRVIDYSQCRKFVDFETYNSWFRKGHPQDFDLLLSTVGSIGEMKLFYGNKGCIAQNVVAFRVDKRISLYFYEYMKFIKKDLISFNIGSVQPSIKITHINKMKILLPNEEMLSKFNDFIMPITEKIFNLSVEIESLKNIRDTLLPKLLSGEIEIPDESAVES